MIRQVSGAMFALVLVSCGPTGEEDVVLVEEPPVSNECGAAEAQDLVGKRVEDLASVTFPAEITRFINPGDVITQDFRAERMNIQFGEDGAISRVYCG